MDNQDEYLFHQGTNYRAYNYMGCHLSTSGGDYCYTFRTWAPNAYSVELISDFTGWNSQSEFIRITDGGIWEFKYHSDTSLEGQAYKFRIRSSSGVHDKGDPYARFSRGKADGASILLCEDNYEWNDGEWMKHRRKTYSRRSDGYLDVPINIYELHFGSFMRHSEDNSYITYREMADVLPPYLKRMGYTHVEFLPLQEYPFDGSWGYQICAFFAPTSRFGTPEDLKYLIDTLHRSGIGVIMDWVPAHFPKDEWGLFEFDGTPLYEYQGWDRIQSPSWGTRFFDLGREEIQSFLVSSAVYFAEEFHFDGLRVDAVASMLYLDFDRAPGEWIPNEDGSNLNKEGAAFIKKFNSVLTELYPDVITVAEESSSYSMITTPVSEGGMGFSMKWNMGWANDFYDYLSSDPVYRRYKHTALNFPLMYAFNERYCMPISHDEVVHGKRSFVDKMHGSLEDKFRQARSAIMLMMTYPGKKLLFMGTEYAQFREWDYENSLEWFMLDYPNHKLFRDYVSSINHFYLSHSELWEQDFCPCGFEWIYADECEKNLLAYKRFDKKGRALTVVINFSGTDQYVSIPCESNGFTKLFDTGSSPDVGKPVVEGDRTVVNVRMPKFSGVILKEKAKTKIINL